MKTNEVSRNLRLAAKLSKNLAEDRTLSLKTLLFQNKYRFYVSYLFISLHFDLVSALIKLWTDLPNLKNSLFILVLLTFLQNVQAVYALINEIIKHDNDLNEILEKIDLLKIEKRLDPWLAKAFLTEILWGKRKLLGDGPLSKSILSYENECRSILGHTDRDKTSERSDNERGKLLYYFFQISL